MNTISAPDWQQLPAAPTDPVLLQRDGGHAVYWVGISDPTAFRCNTYLVVDGDEAFIIDPGNRNFFPRVKAAVATIMPPERVTAMVLCHQDPDVAASMVDWLALNPAIRVFSSPRTDVLLPHYGVSQYAFYDVEAEPEYVLPSGARLQFVGAPFLHSPMAFATYDSASGFAFTGDVFAAVDAEWRLVVEDFTAHAEKMDLFHIDYMASNIAARGFAEKLAALEPTAILPQHGSLIPARFVPDAIDYLRELQCGLDVLYPQLG